MEKISLLNNYTVYQTLRKDEKNNNNNKINRPAR